MASAKLTARDAKRARELADMLENIGAVPLDATEMAWLAAEGRHLGLALKERRKPSRPPRSTGQSREQRRDERRKRIADLREAVMVRADGRCEFCRRDGLPLEWHHIIGGGARRHEEAFDTTCAVCRDCHRDWERSETSTLLVAMVWAKMNGYARAAQAIAKRQAKIAESRAARGEGTGTT